METAIHAFPVLNDRHADALQPAGAVAVTLGEAVLNQLLDFINESTEHPTLLPTQDVLAQRLDVSRVVIREAVVQLIAHGMLTASPRRGTYITERRKWRVVNPNVLHWRAQSKSDRAALLDELAAIVTLIAPSAAADVAAHADDAAMERILATCATRCAARDGRTFRAACANLYLAVFSACKNSLFCQLGALAVEWWAHVGADPDLAFDVSAIELARLASLEGAWRNRNAAAAHDAMRELVTVDYCNGASRHA
ncbi:FadR/GntR family transcriptional regulator [Burkholderia stagnalis]|uniref:FadR/GntR family transcriptional regulator n=1 Tax=Burkholderia stagnalis TaxID=1503054 RepID=UPI000AFD4878|nr:GntR family transcriptional regulator [Burkholderia stagnalis]MDY7806110.1 GntR family transcriptional regulator [Burkholderia stagnalis]